MELRVFLVLFFPSLALNFICTLHVLIVFMNTLIAFDSIVCFLLFLVYSPKTKLCYYKKALNFEQLCVSF